MDTAEFFDNLAYSDVIVKFGTREIKCHKLILCTRSEHFKAMVGSSAKFAESQQAVIELKDDDPDALEAVLRYIYTSKYVKRGYKSDDWRFHLSVSEVADKYLVKTLAEQAFDKFGLVVSNLTDIERVAEMVKVLPTINYRSTELLAIVQQLQDKHFVDLLKQPEYRAMLAADSTLMLSHIERLAIAHGMVKKDFVRCWKCKLQRVVRGTLQHCESCGEDTATWGDFGTCLVEKRFTDAA